MAFPKWLAIDADLVEKLEDASAADDETSPDKLFTYTELDSERIERALELVKDVRDAEVDRETNLNSRGAAVASVAAVIVSVSGFVAQSVFRTEDDWTDWTKLVALGIFLIALFAVAASVFMAVVGVLRPGRGQKSKTRDEKSMSRSQKSRSRRYLGETVVNLWIQGHDRALVDADTDQLNLLRLDRFFRTLPVWHVRNRRKARWLRRAWVFLAAGIVLIAIASVFVLGQSLGLTSNSENGPASHLQFWWIGVFLLGVSAAAYLVVRWDLVKAGSPKDWETEREQTRDEINRLAKHLRSSLDD